MPLSVRQFVICPIFSESRTISTASAEHCGGEWFTMISTAAMGAYTSTYQWDFPEMAELKNAELTVTVRFMKVDGTMNEKQYIYRSVNASSGTDKMNCISREDMGGWINGGVPFFEFVFRLTADFPLVPRDKTRDFSVPGQSDVVLRVGDEKFHVLKAVLSLHSSYFNTLFSGPFSEAQQSEIELKDIDPVTFQQLLQILYVAPDIYEDNVEKLLEMARMYDVKPVIEQCLKFLKGQSDLTDEDKQRLMEEYGIDN